MSCCDIHNRAKKGRPKAFTLPTFALAALTITSLTIITSASAIRAQTVSDSAVVNHYNDTLPRSTSRTARAVRAATAPVVDGMDSDAVWQTAPLVSDFLEYQPRIGAAPRFRTEVRVAFDDKALYVFARMYDPAPDSIVSLLSRRDVRTNSDHFRMVLDSYHDRRTGYEFVVNPAGVKRDYAVYNDNVEDGTWDAVWDVATRIDSMGWTAEYRVPFSQIRFPAGDSHTFGVMFAREIARTGERMSWPLWRLDEIGLISQAGDLSGISNVPSPRRVELTPYLLTRNITRPGVTGESASHVQQSSAGADIKLGLTSNLTIDASINPDFGQVEADPSLLNLSAFEPYFQERRPFFLEGVAIFDFRNNCDDIDSGCTGLFYSRRIGRAPRLSGLYGDAASPAQSTIMGAAKITGRTVGGLSLGLLNATTERMVGSEGRTIEPLTNYAVLRLQQDVTEGKGGIGMMVTAVNRSLDQWTEPWLRSEAYTGGIDGRQRFHDGNYEATFSLSGSHVRGSRSSILDLQSDGVHRYQRPDGVLHPDSARTSLNGMAQRVSVSKFGGGITRFQLVYQRFTPGYETNDLGFQARADEQMLRWWNAFQLNQPTTYYRRLLINMNAGGKWSTAGLPTNNSVNTNWHMQLPSQWWLHANITMQNAVSAYDDRVTRGGAALRSPRDLRYGFSVEGDARMVLVPVLEIAGRKGDEGHSSYLGTYGALDFRSASRFSASVSASWGHTRSGAQWLRNETSASNGVPRSLFSPLEQTTVSSNLRVNYTATSTLSLQIWGQPYITSGEYQQLMEPVNPRAAHYSDRWRVLSEDAGGFRFREWRSNVVLRWEYRPASTLFLVWQHGRSAYDDDSDFSVGRDLQQLFGLPPDNTFLLKVSYWFNP